MHPAIGSLPSRRPVLGAARTDTDWSLRGYGLNPHSSPTRQSETGEGAPKKFSIRKGTPGRVERHAGSGKLFY